MMPRPRTKRPWHRRVRNPLTTLPAMAAAPVIMGPGFLIAGIVGLFRDSSVTSQLGNLLAIVTGALTVALVVIYVRRPSSRQGQRH